MIEPSLVYKALAYSSNIALMAAGITMIYMSTETFNFAHASKVSWGMYFVYTFYNFFGGHPYIYVPVAAILTGLIGVAMYLTFNRYLLKRGAGMITLMMSTLGADLILLALLNILADYLSRVHKLYSRQIRMEIYDFTVAGIPFSTLIALIIVVTLTASIHLFLTKTKFGIAMRATIENPNLAGILGINPELVYLTSWFIGGALAGLGGALLVFIMAGYPVIGQYLIVTMFAGSIVGGLYSIYGSLLGGFLVGLSEYLGIWWLSTLFGGKMLAYRQVIPLVAMVVALLFFPQGLGGIKWGKVAKVVRGERS